MIFEGEIKAVLALASLNEFDSSHLAFLEQLTANIGIVLNSIEVTMQTEALLKQSQQLAAELQAQQTSCSRPTISSGRKRSSWRSRTPRSSARTGKSSRRGARSRKKRQSWR